MGEGGGAPHFRKGCGWHESLSLTPALSRWERENPSRSPLMTYTGARGEISHQSVTARSLFPLPAGEGRVRENLPTGCEVPFLEMLPKEAAVATAARNVWRYARLASSPTEGNHPTSMATRSGMVGGRFGLVAVLPPAMLPPVKTGTFCP